MWFESPGPAGIMSQATTVKKSVCQVADDENNAAKNCAGALADSPGMLTGRESGDGGVRMLSGHRRASLA